MSWDDEDDTEEGWFDHTSDTTWGHSIDEAATSTVPSSSVMGLPTGPGFASSSGLPSGPPDAGTVDEKMEEIKDEMESVKRKMDDLTLESKGNHNSSGGLPSGPSSSRHETNDLPSGPSGSSASSSSQMKEKEDKTSAELDDASDETVAKKKKKRRRKKKKKNMDGLKKCHECGNLRPEETGEQRGAHWYCRSCASKVQCQECLRYVFPEDGKEDKSDQQFYCNSCWHHFEMAQKAAFKKVDPSTYLSGSRIERMERARYKDW